MVLLTVACIGGSSIVAHRELRSLNPVVTSSLLLGTAAPLLFLASFALERGQPVEWNANAIGALGGRLWAASEGPGRGASMHLMVPIGSRANVPIAGAA